MRPDSESASSVNINVENQRVSGTGLDGLDNLTSQFNEFINLQVAAGKPAESVLFSEFIEWINNKAHIQE